MAKPFSTLTDKMDPERVARVVAKVNALLDRELVLPPAYKDFVVYPDITPTHGYCIFCRCHTSDAEKQAMREAVPVNKTTCTYGALHSFHLDEKPKEQKKVVDKQLCLVCGKHPKNPAYATNGCQHKHGV